MNTIFLDMDGVIADWSAMAHSILGYHSVGDIYSDEDWDKLKSNEHFYRELPLMKDAREFVKGVQKVAHEQNMRVIFLTAIPHNNDMPWSFWDKFQWAQEHFPDVPVWFGPYSHDKKLRAINNILIDDRKINIEEWEQAGGTAIHCTGNLLESLEQLKCLYK